MGRKMTLVYWKSEKFWLGKLLEYPEIMTGRNFGGIGGEYQRRISVDGIG